MARASPPSVIRLIVCPVSQSAEHRAPSERERDVEHDDECAPPVAQEEQHHQPDEDGAQQPFGHHAGHGARDIRRLVELEATSILRCRRGKASCIFGRAFLMLLMTRQRRGVGPLRRQDVDGPPAVGEGVAGRRRRLASSIVATSRM